LLFTLTRGIMEEDRGKKIFLYKEFRKKIERRKGRR